MAHPAQLAGALGVLVVPIALIGFTFAYQLSAEERVITLDAGTAERVCTGTSNSTSCKYMVYADQGVFENTDDPFSLKFNSADFHAQLRGGGEFLVTTKGWRVAFLSMQPNIVALEEVES